MGETNLIMFTSPEELHQALTTIATGEGESMKITNEDLLRQTVIDQLVHTAVFSDNEPLKKEARVTIRQIASLVGAVSSSMHTYYLAIGEGKAPTTSTVPAINVRAMTFDFVRLVFRLKQAHRIGPVIFEIARSEIDYTAQRPDEFSVVILAAAIKENYRGPIFIQGDHFQFSARRYKEDPETETNKIKSLIKEAVDADFQNIDIDASTLVDLSQPTQDLQQAENYKVTSLLTAYIRSLQTKGTISIGAEIGHIGGKNSTPEELQAFMDGFLRIINGKIPGISKISVQTGTSHGGIPLPNGKIAEVKLDFSVIEKTGTAAREKYHIGGVVQHGASTLPNELFDQFPLHKTLEIHLATGFQNIIYDALPQTLKEEMYSWIEANYSKEWEEGWNKEQFIYKTRKKAIGPFKKQLWNLSEDEKKPIIESLEKQLTFLFQQLNVLNTLDVVEQYV